MPKTTGSFQILESAANTVTIDDDCIPNTFSIYHETLAPNRTTCVTQELTNPENRADLDKSKDGMESDSQSSASHPLPALTTPNATNIFSSDDGKTV